MKHTEDTAFWSWKSSLLIFSVLLLLHTDEYLTLRPALWWEGSKQSPRELKNLWTYAKCITFNQNTIFYNCLIKIFQYLKEKGSEHVVSYDGRFAAGHLALLYCLTRSALWSNNNTSCWHWSNVSEHQTTFLSLISWSSYKEVTARFELLIKLYDQLP